MLVLLDDDRGRMTLQRLRPWHKILARSQAARLDRELAGGASPEASAALAARAIQLTSMEFRRALAASLQRVLVAAGSPPWSGHSRSPGTHRSLLPARRGYRSAGRGSASPLPGSPLWPAAWSSPAPSRCAAWRWSAS